MATIRCGMAQLYVEGGKPGKNLARAVDLISRAMGEKCDVAVLPECCDLGWTDPSAVELATPIPEGTSFQRLAEAASQHSIHVVAGLVEKDGDLRYNTAVLISPEGKLIAKSRKINELTIALPPYSVGNQLSAGHTPFGSVGLNICADNFSNSLVIADVLCRMGADMILSPCAWADDAEGKADFRYHVEFWTNSYARIAKHYKVSIVGVSNVGQLDAGPWKGRQAVGSSVAVGPDGEVLGLCKTGYTQDAEQLLVVELPILPREGKGTDVKGLF